jgi:Cu-Zn family superoxide dismutase
MFPCYLQLIPAEWGKSAHMWQLAGAGLRLCLMAGDGLPRGTTFIDRSLGVCYRRPLKLSNEESLMKIIPVKSASPAGLSLFAAAMLACFSLPGHASKLMATADIKGCTDSSISGMATFREEVTDEGIKEVTIHIRVEGLSDGKHAVHIHETAACKPCSAANGHHDPGPFGETRPDSAGDTIPATDINHPYHMGDLINIEVKNGRGTMKHTSNRVTLSAGRLSLFDADGSSIIIHTNEDTYCDEESDLKKGCAGGSRDACGIIVAD